MRSFILFITVFLFLGLPVGCDTVTGVVQKDEDIDLSKATRATVNGLGIHLSVPDTVAVADSFSVQVVVSNPSQTDRSVTTPSACLVRPGVVSGDIRVPIKGSTLLCAAAITTHHIPAGELEKRRFDMQAVLDTSEGEQSVSPGTYTVQATLNWKINGEEIHHTVTKELVIQQ
jgi:hypothetical protein